jgi:hypothetical protein
LHMKIYPACNGSVIIVDYTSPHLRALLPAVAGGTFVNGL